MKPKNHPRDACVPVGSGRKDERICGGSRAQPNVSSTGMHQTANGTRHCNDISMSAMSPGGHGPHAVPLYLIAQVVAAAVGRHGRAVREIHIIGTAGHYYTVTTITRQEAQADD
jgi:hypothetical protein